MAMETTPHDGSAPVVAAHELRADAHGPLSGRARPARGQRPSARQIGRRLLPVALVHELVHWQHGDDTSNGCRGGKLEQRCRHETAILLINPAEYALAERMYDGNPYQIAAELNVTIQIIQDYRQWLHDNVTV